MNMKNEDVKKLIKECIQEVFQEYAIGGYSTHGMAADLSPMMEEEDYVSGFQSEDYSSVNGYAYRLKECGVDTRMDYDNGKHRLMVRRDHLPLAIDTLKNSADEMGIAVAEKMNNKHFKKSNNKLKKTQINEWNWIVSEKTTVDDIINETRLIQEFSFFSDATSAITSAGDDIALVAKVIRSLGEFILNPLDTIKGIGVGGITAKIALKLVTWLLKKLSKSMLKSHDQYDSDKFAAGSKHDMEMKAFQERLNSGKKVSPEEIAASKMAYNKAISELLDKQGFSKGKKVLYSLINKSIDILSSKTTQNVVIIVGAFLGKSMFLEEEMNKLNEEIEIQQVSEISKSDMGHMALDLLGLIPVVGNFADLANVLWYLKKKEYLLASLSLLSAIPAIGQWVGGTKIAGKLTMAAAKGSKSAKTLSAAGKATMILGKNIQKVKSIIKNNPKTVEKVMNMARKDKRMATHADEMKRAVIEFSNT